jgi:hypothetical protein
MRTFLTSAMAILVIAALFWGNCLTCPQAVSAVQKHEGAHACCHKSQPGSEDCPTQNLQNFVKADIATPAPALVPAGAVEPALLSHAEPWFFVAERVIHTPADLLALKSSLRI